MVNFVFFYADLAQRQTISASEATLEHRFLHNDFVDNLGNPTDGTSGRLTFTDDPEPPPAPNTPTTTEVFAIAQADAVNLDLIDSSDVLGESAYAEASNLTPGPQQTDITNTYTPITQFDTVGLMKNLTVAANAITVALSGFYSIEYYLSFTGSSAQIYQMAIHVNGTEIVKSSVGRTVSAASDVGSVANKCILQLTAADVVDVRVKTIGAGPNNFTVQLGNFIIQKVR